jgi:glycosyltransferase involved in cell wall biosynthesis
MEIELSSSTNGRQQPDPVRALWVPLWYPSPEAPNQNVWARELAKAVALRCELRVVHAAIGEPKSSVSDEQGIVVARVRFRQRRFHWVIPYIRAVLGAAATIRRRFAFDLVHAHCAFPAGLAGLCLSVRYNVPLVLTEHWAPYDQLMLSSPLTARSIRAVVRRAASVAAVSRSLRAEMAQWTGRRDIEIVPPAVDVSVFHPPAARQRSDDEVHLLFVGDLSHARKRLEDVLQALAVLSAREPTRRWHLDVVGGGALLPDYRAQVTSLGLDSMVHFRGELGLVEVAVAMRECDVFVMPSDYETFGVVYAEALACGKPVVASRCGGPEDFVTDDVGRLVPPQDVAALVRALGEVVDRLDTFPPERLRLFATERFSHAVVGGRYAEIYRRVLR